MHHSPVLFFFHVMDDRNIFILLELNFLFDDLQKAKHAFIKEEQDKILSWKKVERRSCSHFCTLFKVI